jgi:hypothetical protein
MFNTLTQRVKADEQELTRLVELSLRIAGVLVAAILVFMALYFFIASLDVPVIHRRTGVGRRAAIAIDETVASTPTLLCGRDGYLGCYEVLDKSGDDGTPGAGSRWRAGPSLSI